MRFKNGTLKIFWRKIRSNGFQIRKLHEKTMLRLPGFVIWTSFHPFFFQVWQNIFMVQILRNQISPPKEFLKDLHQKNIFSNLKKNGWKLVQITNPGNLSMVFSCIFRIWNPFEGIFLQFFLIVPFLKRIWRLESAILRVSGKLSMKGFKYEENRTRTHEMQETYPPFFRPHGRAR